MFHSFALNKMCLINTVNVNEYVGMAFEGIVCINENLISFTYFYIALKCMSVFPWST